MKKIMIAAALMAACGIGATAPAAVANDCTTKKVVCVPSPPPCIAQTNGSYCPQP